MGNSLYISLIAFIWISSSWLHAGTAELIRCRVCFGKVSTNAATCVHCGEPNFRSTGKVIEKEALQDRAGTFYEVNDTKPFTGWVVDGRYVSGHPKIEQEYREGKKWGERRKWYENGQLMQKSLFTNGTLEGKMLEWHENGALMAEGNFTEGKLNGLVRRWYTNGKREAEYSYRDGKLDGLIHQWNRSGNMIARKKFDAGKLIARMAVDPPENASSPDPEDPAEEASKKPGSSPASNVFEGLELGFPNIPDTNP